MKPEGSPPAGQQKECRFKALQCWFTLKTQKLPLSFMQSTLETVSSHLRSLTHVNLSGHWPKRDNSISTSYKLTSFSLTSLLDFSHSALLGSLLDKWSNGGLVSKQTQDWVVKGIRLRKISNQSDQVAFEEEGYHNHIFKDFLITFKKPWNFDVQGFSDKCFTLVGEGDKIMASTRGGRFHSWQYRHCCFGFQNEQHKNKNVPFLSSTNTSFSELKKHTKEHPTSVFVDSDNWKSHLSKMSNLSQAWTHCCCSFLWLRLTGCVTIHPLQILSAMGCYHNLALQS